MPLGNVWRTLTIKAISRIAIEQIAQKGHSFRKRLLQLLFIKKRSAAKRAAHNHRVRNNVHHVDDRDFLGTWSVNFSHLMFRHIFDWLHFA